MAPQLEASAQSLYQCRVDAGSLEGSAATASDVEQELDNETVTESERQTGLGLVKRACITFVSRRRELDLQGFGHAGQAVAVTSTMARQTSRSQQESNSFRI